MVITIENPTAETIYAALRDVPAREIERLKELLNAEKPYWEDATFSSEWSEEDLRDLDRSTAQLIDERFGPEEGNYD